MRSRRDELALRPTRTWSTTEARIAWRNQERPATRRCGCPDGAVPIAGCPVDGCGHRCVGVDCVYFCDPHSPCQRRTNEDTNGCYTCTSRGTGCRPRRSGNGPQPGLFTRPGPPRLPEHPPDGPASDRRTSTSSNRPRLPTDCTITPTTTARRGEVAGPAERVRRRCVPSYQGRPCSTTVFSSVISATARRGPSLPYPLLLRPP